ncbi:ubiquinol-cytochrome c reductase iron-sulfur subunit [Sporichthya polymorpha]|uniref:cytochrome bc1 complex Rieske iron-sulfur subunit n=1 Tax=Sporichthya polymorpha TaxID=35751 RepID=UPI00039C0E7D|nr:Rieske 2Fe-2S domain-containing protein [Sporichthya polymorpha]
MSYGSNDGGHGTGVAQVEGDPFADPGLPHHTPRRTDIDARAANRAERQVAGLFGLSTILTIAFIVSFVAIDKDESMYVVGLGTVNTLNFALGVTLGGSLLCIGFGAIHWARKLMNAEEVVDYRHPMKSSPEDTAEVLEKFRAGVEDSAIPRRKLIWTSMLGAMALFPIAPVIALRDLGPLPHKKLRGTLWDDPNHRQIVHANDERRLKPSDFALGSMISAKPNDLEGHDELAKASILLVKLNPSEIRSKELAARGYRGILAYSKICPHAGCPLGLYEKNTHHMLCPCHQSTFDLADFGRVVFGPSARNLPNIAITVDDEGYLVAKGGFEEPVGPSFWERGDA